MKWFFLIYILVVFVSCKKADDNKKTYKSAVKSEVISNNSSNQINDQDEHLTTYKLPFGAEELVSTKFPKDTSIVFGYNMKERPEIESSIEKISKYYQIFNLWNKEDSIKASYNNEKISYSSERNSYSYYDIPLVTNIKSKEADSVLFYCRSYNSFVKTGKVSGFHDYDLFTYTTFPKYYNNNEVEKCNGDNLVVVTDLVVKSKEGKLVDMLNIYYSTDEPYNTYQVYPYIDENYIINPSFLF